MIILDTNVLSELMRPAPSHKVVAWISTQRVSDLHTTTITQAEILYGLALLPEGRRRSELTQAATQTFAEDFMGRVLVFDSAAAEVFGPITAKRRQRGRPIAAFDAQIAAIAVSRGMRLATRNISDFADCEVDLVNPWEA